MVGDFNMAKVSIVEVDVDASELMFHRPDCSSQSTRDINP